MEDFAGKTVIVTGGGRGVGRGVGMAFAAAGANVMLGARILRMVAITLIAPMTDEIPIKCTPKIKKSVLAGAKVVDKGA